METDVMIAVQNTRKTVESFDSAVLIAEYRDNLVVQYYQSADKLMSADNAYFAKSAEYHDVRRKLDALLDSYDVYSAEFTELSHRKQALYNDMCKLRAAVNRAEYDHAIAYECLEAVEEIIAEGF